MTFRHFHCEALLPAIVPALFLAYVAAQAVEPLKLSPQPIATRAEWEDQIRPEILRRIQQVTGPLPGNEKWCDLEPRIMEETDCGSYLRRLITYQAEPGQRVPAYLLVPKKVLNGSAKAPGVLCLHQTHPAGHKVVVGLGESPNDEYAVELVQRGFVCIAPPYPLLANYAPDLAKLGYSSGTMKAIWDNIRALDFLETLPFVQPGQFAAIGHSLGGHNGLFTAVFEPRIKIVVTSCGFDSFRDYMNGNIRGWTSERYMPKLLDYTPAERPFDFQHVLAAIAPRRIFVSAPTGDTNFKAASVDAIAEAVLPLFRLYQAEDRLLIRHPEAGHLFPEEQRQESYRLIEETIAARPQP